MLSTESTTSNIHHLDGFMEFQGCTIRKPQTRLDYIRICRRFMNEKDYVATMKAIFDTESYEQSDESIQRIVDNYYSFPGDP
jgi:hypothetical protein